MDNNVLSDRLQAVMARFRNGCRFMDGPASVKEKERWQPQFYRILAEVDELTEGFTEAEKIELRDSEGQVTANETHNSRNENGRP